MSTRARPNIFEAELGGETLFYADQITGLGFEKDVIEEPMADGEDEPLDGGRKLRRFRVHSKDVAKFKWFFDWYNKPISEPLDFAIHRKNIKGDILQTVEMETVKPVSGELDDFNRTTKTEIHGHWFDLIGRVVTVD